MNNVKKKIIDGVAYELHHLEQTITFICDKCGKEKGCNTIVYYDDMAKRMCNTCYGQMIGAYKKGKRETFGKSEDGSQREVYNLLPLMQSKLAQKEQCVVCGSKLTSGHVKAILSNDKRQYIIGTVPVHYCNKCHIGYAASDTSGKIRKLYPSYRANMFMIGNSKNKNILKSDLWRQINYISNKESKKIQGAKVMEPKIEEKKFLVEKKNNNQNDKTKIEVVPDNTTFYVGDKGSHLCAGPMEGSLYQYTCFLTDKSGGLIQFTIKKCIRCGKLFVSDEFYEKWKSRLIEYNYLTNQGEKILGPEEYIHDISPKTFLTRVNVSYCSEKGHDLVDIRCRVKLLTKGGLEAVVVIPAAYCPQCKKYYILDSEYKRLKIKGIIICKVVKQEYWTKDFGSNNWGLKDESDLHIMGYNVNAQNNLPQNLRWKILEMIVDEGVMTRIEICSHLDSLIKRSKNRPELSDACSKWITDRDYIRTYNSDKLLSLDTEKIIIKRRI